MSKMVDEQRVSMPSNLLCPSSIGMDQLPTEILAAIVSCPSLSREDLYTLALLSRRLNSIATPLFLATFGILHPSSSLTIYLISAMALNGATHPQIEIEPLAGLAIHLDLESIGCLRCHLADEVSVNHGSVLRLKLQAKIQQLTRIVSRLKFVKEMHVYLNFQDYERLFKNYCFKAQTNSGSDPWSVCLQKLLDAAVSKGCSQIVISEDPFPLFGQNFFCIRRMSPSFLSRLKNPFSRRSPSPQSKGAVAKTVRSLSIHTPLYLGSGYLKWTVSLLKTQPITRLSLRDFRPGSSKGWISILERISSVTSNRLTELYLSNCVNGLSVSDIIYFLRRLPNLTTLAIDPNFECRSWPRKRPPTAHFPRLRHLRAPDSFVAHFLGIPILSAWMRPELSDGMLANPSRLPMLEYLCVTPFISIYDLRDLFTVASNWNASLEMILPRRRSPNIALSLDLYKQGIYIRLEDVREAVDALTSSDEQIANINKQGKSFKYVTDLRLSGYNASYSVDLELLGRWLRLLFPDVTELTLPLHSNREELDLGIGIIPAHFASFVQTVCRASPKIVKVNLGKWSLDCRELSNVRVIRGDCNHND